ncbi:hypothetical protein Ac2012v2_006377 [Leucoagaricus gongylophorus]
MTTVEAITKFVNAAYGERARSGTDKSFSTTVAYRAGYTTEQLSSLPEGANLGLSCGCPVLSSRLQRGEVVLDLGSGGGLDVFLAAHQVGPTGTVIGLDASEDMIALARRNAKSKGLRPPHVAFAKASLAEELPIESASVDCVISNCVLNLLPGEGKIAVLKDAFRALKPGGRLNLADVIALHEIPADIKNDLGSFVDCISGAVSEEEYRSLLQVAGFINISFVREGELTACGSGPQRDNYSESPNQKSMSPTNSGDFVASYRITAFKPNSAETISPTALKNWWYAYPEVKSTPDALTVEQVAAMIRDPSQGRKDFTVIDVRQNDHTGGHVRGSFQCPAQSFYDDSPGYFERFKDSEKVIFYCQSSNGRGSRCAGWYQDYLDSVGCNSSEAYIMAGGIKEWMGKFKGEEDLVDCD